MKRSEVYALIDGERDYQESLWPVNPLQEGEFIALLQDYVDQARSIWVREPKPCQETMGIIRKIAAIAVNAMEQHGAPARGTFRVITPVVDPDERQMDLPLAESPVEPGENPGDLDLAPEPVSYQGKSDAKITIADLEVAVSKYYKGNGLAATKSVLEKFGAARVGDVPAEQHAAFLAELTA